MNCEQPHDPFFRIAKNRCPKEAPALANRASIKDQGIEELKCPSVSRCDCFSFGEVLCR